MIIYRHVVLLKFTGATTLADVKKVEDAFNSLPSQIPQIKGYEWGINDTAHNPTKNEGFTNCYFLTFNSVEDFETYENSTPHQAFLHLAKPYLDNAIVICYFPE